MKHSFCLMVFTLWLAVVHDQAHAAPPLPALAESTYTDLQPLKRVVREMPKMPPGMPPPPDMKGGMPPPPNMNGGMPPPPDVQGGMLPPPPDMQASMPPPQPGMELSSLQRKKREAKGGGAMPTRKG